MPTSGPKSPADWFAGELTGGCLPDLSGDLSLQRENMVEDFRLQELTPDGGTKTMRVVGPPVFDGDHYYLSKAGAKRETVSRQTYSPMNPGESWHGLQPQIDGPRPLGFDPTMPQLTVRKIKLAQNKQGFPGGRRLACISFVSAGGAHTTTTDPVEFTISTGDAIKITLFDEVSEGTEEIGIWLSEEAKGSAEPDPSTIRLQDTVSAGTRTHTLYGPFRPKGRTRPQRNETAVGRPAQLKVGPRGDVRLKKAVYDLKVGIYNFCHVETNPRGASAASVRTNTRRIDRPMLDTAWWVRPEKVHPDTTGYLVFVQIDEDGESWHQLVRPGRTYRSRPFPVDEAVPVYGNTDSGESEDEENASEDGDSVFERNNNYRFVLVASEPPELESDSTGIEPPTGQIDPPSGVTGVSRPAAGKYLATYARQENGQVLKAAPPVRFELASGEYPVLSAPGRVNRLPNPEGGEIGADGLPIGWDATETDGIVNDRPGKIGMTCGPALNDAISPIRRSERVLVNAATVETVRGELEVTSYAAGTARVWLEQTHSDGTQTRSLLRSLAQNGRGTFRKTIGFSGMMAAGSAPEVVLDDDTTEIGLRLDFIGNPRQMIARVFNLALHPFVGAPRKLEFPKTGEVAIIASTSDHQIPYPPGSVIGITEPPPAGAAYVPENLRPFASVDFNNIPDGSVNPIISGWTFSRSGGAVTARVVPVAALEGISQDLGMRIEKNTSGVYANCSYEKTFTSGGQTSGDGTQLGVRFLFRPVFMSGADALVRFCPVTDTQGSALAIMTFSRGGTLQLRTISATGYERRLTLLQGVSMTEVLDIELLVSGADSSSGKAEVILARGSDERRSAGSLENINYSGKQAAKIRAGIAGEASSAGRWAMDFDRIRVTRQGDIMEVQPPPPDEPPAPPDRPTGADGVYRQVDPKGDPIYQYILFTAPGERDPEEMRCIHRDFVIRPGVPNTAAVYMRHEDVYGEYGGPRLTLFSESGEYVRIPNFYDAGSLTGTSGWIEPFEIFTPQEGFYRARLEIPASLQGLVLAQEAFVGEGSLETRVKRDALRTKKYVQSGGFKTVVRLGSPDSPDGILDFYHGDGWTGVGCDAETPGTSSLAPQFATTNDENLIKYTPRVSDPALVVPGRAARIEGTLTASVDRYDAPVVPSTGVYVEYAPYLGAERLATLSFVDGSSFPGGTVVDGLEEPVEAPDYTNTDGVGGRPRPTPLTEEIDRLGSFRVYFFTSLGANLFERLSAKREWLLEAPGLGNGSRGMVFRIALYDRVDVVEVSHSVIVHEGVRYAVGIAEIPRAEVLESRPLQRELVTAAGTGP